MVENAAAKPDERLAALRKAMAAADDGKGVQAFLVPTEDPHMSEYPPSCFSRREFISRFTGTAGTAVVTTDKALLWTDGRYFLQAVQELGPEWTLMRAGTPGCPDIEDWLADNLPDGGRVGVDPFVHTIDSGKRLKRKLEDSGKELVPLLKDGNLVDKAWGSERPGFPMDKLRIHDIQWAGESVPDKMARMRKQMKDAHADVLLVTSLDEVAWLFNLRGSDVACNPVFVSYAALPLEGNAVLYVDEEKIPGDVKEHLKASGVDVSPYSAMVPDVAESAKAGKTLWVDPSKVSFAIYQAAQEAAAAATAAAKGKSTGRKRTNAGDAVAAPRAKLFVEQPSPVVYAKAIKNEAELSGMREAHLRDSEALCDFLMWIEKHIGEGNTLTECQVDEHLTARRAAQPGFIGPSFATIAGAGPNGAVIHYRAQPESCRTVDKHTMLLLDSGGQYLCGTTDITRTMHFGIPSDIQKQAYTLVLKGHIQLDLAVFPEGTPGCAIDAFARMHLWKQGLNYRHGTGHGVGAALNVHEGPQSISSRFNITTGLANHMICSNEPGYYEDGVFGVRIENLVEVREVETMHRFAGVPYLGFRRLTLVPIQTKMIDASQLKPEEVAWLDQYHADVWAEVSPRLQGKPEVLEWLKKNTRPLAEQQS